MHNNIAIWFLFTLIVTSVAHAAESLVLPTNQNVHIRGLAASCAACHGTNGNSVGKAITLTGMEKTDIQAKLLSFKSGEREATVMQEHARGLNAHEIEELATYFSAQTPKKITVLIPQVLQKDHMN